MVLIKNGLIVRKTKKVDGKKMKQQWWNGLNKYNIYFKISIGRSLKRSFMVWLRIRYPYTMHSVCSDSEVLGKVSREHRYNRIDEAKSKKKTE